MVSPWWSKVGIRKGGRRTPQNKSEKRRKLTGNADEKRAAWLNQAALAVTHAIILSHYDSKTTPNLFQDVPICSKDRALLLCSLFAIFCAEKRTPGRNFAWRALAVLFVSGWAQISRRSFFSTGKERYAAIFCSSSLTALSVASLAQASQQAGAMAGSPYNSPR